MGLILSIRCPHSLPSPSPCHPNPGDGALQRSNSWRAKTLGRLKLLNAATKAALTRVSPESPGAASPREKLSLGALVDLTDDLIAGGGYDRARISGHSNLHT